jgi:hypothetical protein
MGRPTRRARPGTSKLVEGEPERAEPNSAMGEAQEGVQRPWWRRLFGG